MRALGARDQLLLEMETARARVLDAIAGLTEEQMSRPGIDGWSVKDHLNHLTACDEFRFYEIGRISRGGSPAFRDMDRDQTEALNGLIVTLRRALPLDQVRTDLQFARSLVLEAIRGAPEHALAAEPYGDFPVDGSIPHDFEHAAAITAWRQREGL
ncbi:MAG TPA: DinB family protein [Dehalococcoidia bacterium]|nr:DinB family protein [Dehalococcoidia bacterium]